MDRQEQLKILWNHPNTENINPGYSPDSDKKMHKVGYHIGEIYALLELGYKIRTFKTSKELEPHRIDLFCPSGKYSFSLKIPTQPIGKWEIGRRDWKYPGALSNAPNLEVVGFKSPVDQAHLKIKSQEIIDSICEKENIPCLHYEISFGQLISNFRYKEKSSGFIASSLTDTLRHGWFLSPIGEIPKWQNPQRYQEDHENQN